MSTHMALQVAALVSWILATIPVAIPRINVLALGLVFFALSWWF